VDEVRVLEDLQRIDSSTLVAKVGLEGKPSMDE